MSATIIFNIVTESWGIVFCLVGFLLLRIINGEKGALFGQTGMIICTAAIISGLDLINYLIEGRDGSLVCYALIGINSLYYILVYVLLFLGFHYYSAELKEKLEVINKGFLAAEAAFAIAGCLIVAGNLLFPGLLFRVTEQNIYTRGSTVFYVTQALGIGMALVTLFMAAGYKQAVSRSNRTLLKIMIPLALGAIVTQFFVKDTGLLDIILCIYSVLQAVCLVTDQNRARESRDQELAAQQMELLQKDAELDRQNRLLQKQETELERRKTQLLASQIRPHFIFNSLLAIRSLCMEDVDLAIESINHFSKYLRIVLDTMNSESMISFGRELELTENYVYMEQLRFDKSKIVFQKELEVTNFSVPVMTLQPIVENSIRHGIRGSEKSGIIRITTREQGEDIVLCVYDHGVGFDPNVRKEDGRVHVGLDNVRARLEMMCGGRLEVESVIGQGTTVTMYLPEKNVLRTEEEPKWTIKED